MDSKRTESILLIEDSPELRDSLAEILSLEGYKLSSVADGETGLGLACTEAFDLILCDIGLPGLSGFDVLDQLKRGIGDLNKSTPFVFLTGDTNSSSWSKGLKCGAEDYLLKPVNIDELLITVSSRIGKQKMVRERFELQQRSHARELEKIIQFISNDLRSPLCSGAGLANLLLANSAVPAEGTVKDLALGIVAAMKKLDKTTLELAESVSNALMRSRKEKALYAPEAIQKAGKVQFI
jgi:CheY-like chemotaxis protein